MAERVQIVLEAQDMASGVMRGIVSRFGALGAVVSDTSDAFGRFTSFLDLQKRSATDATISAGMLEKSYADAGMAMARLGETLAVAVVQTVQEAIKVTDAYNESIRDLSLVSGESAENTSRFIQVLDDFGLTADDAMTAAKALKEKGLSPNIDTLAALADEFKKIKDPAERMAFVQENLGKGGAKWVAVLNQESDALRKTAASVDSYLVKSDEQIKKAEIARLAIDNLSDSWAAFQNRIGDTKNELIFANEASNRAYEILKKQGVEINGATNRTQEYRDALEQAKEELLASGEASIEYTENLEEQARQLEEVSKANRALVDGAIEITSRNKDFAESQQEILQKIAETRAEGEKLYPWEAEKIEENKQKLAELGQSYSDNLEEFRSAMEEKFTLYAVEQIALSDGVEGFSEAELQKAQMILQTADVATAAAFEEQQAMALLAQAVADGVIPVEEWGAVLEQVMADGGVSIDEVQAKIESVPKQNTITFDIVTNGAPPNLAPSDYSAPVGTHRNGHADGGMFMIPAGYGNEGFNMGRGDTASGGELVSITPRGKDPNAGVIEAVLSTRIDYNELARAIVSASQQSSK